MHGHRVKTTKAIKLETASVRRRASNKGWGAAAYNHARKVIVPGM